MIGALPRALNTAGPLGSVVHRPKSWHGIPSGLYPQSLSKTMKPPRFSALNTCAKHFANGLPVDDLDSPCCAKATKELVHFWEGAVVGDNVYVVRAFAK